MITSSSGRKQTRLLGDKEVEQRESKLLVLGVYDSRYEADRRIALTFA